MAHHKRGRAKNRRAGCLHCKPWKANGAKKPDGLQELKAKISEAEQTSDRESKIFRWSRSTASTRPASIDRR